MTHDPSYGPGDPFYNNATLETCAYLCATSLPTKYSVARGIEDGGPLAVLLHDANWVEEEDGLVQAGCRNQA